ncbi:hypothetical protein BKA81DRAFT_38597 [Phyllosticta paracitricarpa]
MEGSRERRGIEGPRKQHSTSVRVHGQGHLIGGERLAQVVSHGVRVSQNHVYDRSLRRRSRAKAVSAQAAGGVVFIDQRLNSAWMHGCCDAQGGNGSPAYTLSSCQADTNGRPSTCIALRLVDFPYILLLRCSSFSIHHFLSSSTARRLQLLCSGRQLALFLPLRNCFNLVLT